MTDPSASPEARLIHAGTRRELGAPISPPLVPASVYASWGEPDPARAYGRTGNPGWEALEEALGGLEDAGAVVFSSGQAASMALLLALAEGRRTVLLPTDGYYNIRVLVSSLRPHGAEPVFVDLLDLDQVARELDAGPAVLWAETPTNPLLRVADLGALAGLAAAAGAPLVVDNTVPTGLLQRPLDLGAVAPMCSLTKSASGHSDVLLGAVATRDQDLLEKVRGWRGVGGGIPGPFESWLVLRGLRTLALRLQRQSENALAIAQYLGKHPRVRAVHYPGTTAATLETARRQMPRGFGPLLSFELDGSAADADAVVAASRLILPATSFGGVESVWERRGRWSSETAPESLIRLGTGIDPADDLLADLDHSLTAAAG